jgi:hypothetical protein
MSVQVLDTACRDPHLSSSELVQSSQRFVTLDYSPRSGLGFRLDEKSSFNQVTDAQSRDRPRSRQK